VNKILQFQDFPTKFAEKRFRTDIEPGSLDYVGRVSNIDQFGVERNGYDVPFYSYPRVLKCWDELHWWIQTFDLIDVGPYVPKHRVNGKRYREAGPLALYRCRMPYKVMQAADIYKGQDLRPFGFLNQYAGGFTYANWSHGFSENEFFRSGEYGQTISNSYESVSQHGAEAYKRFKPKTSAFDAMQFLFDDIKDLPGQLATTSKLMSDSYKGFLKKNATRSQRKFAREALMQPDRLAGDYLNYQFGWAPFVGDLIKLAKAYESFHKRYTQVARDNGHWIKRGGTVLEAREELYSAQLGGSGNVYPQLTGDFYANPLNAATSWLSHYVERHVWFTGEFKYYIPGYTRNPSSIDNYELMVAMLRHYGVFISPSVVWELTPWTWLVDWFTNASAVIDNISSVQTDGLVSRNACLMGHGKHYVTNQSIIHLKSGDKNCFWLQEVETKRREYANPYGFGVSDFDLNVRQLSILAALGISRGGIRSPSGGPR